MTWTLQEREKIDELSEGVKSLDRAIRGSNGTAGVLTRIGNIDQQLQAHVISEQACPIHSVMTTLQGDVKKGLDTKGLVDVVNDHSRFIGTIRKWTYGMIASTSIAVIALIFELLKPLIIK